MAWNPKTAIGKILKSAVSAAPLALSLVPGIGPAVAAVTGVVKSAVTKGTEKLKAASTMLDGITAAAMTDPVNQNAGVIATGDRTAINNEKVIERDALGRVVVDRSTEPIPNFTPYIIGGGALLGLLLLSKMKRKR